MQKYRYRYLLIYTVCAHSTARHLSGETKNKLKAARARGVQGSTSARRTGNASPTDSVHICLYNRPHIPRPLGSGWWSEVLCQHPFHTHSVWCVCLTVLCQVLRAVRHVLRASVRATYTVVLRVVPSSSRAVPRDYTVLSLRHATGVWPPTHTSCYMSTTSYAYVVLRKYDSLHLRGSTPTSGYVSTSFYPYVVLSLRRATTALVLYLRCATPTPC